MANWRYELNIKDIWKKLESDEIDVKEAGKRIAKVIKESSFFEKERDNDLEIIALDFEYSVDDVETFDSIMESLYNWGDQDLPTQVGMMQRKICWINTFFTEDV